MKKNNQLKMSPTFVYNKIEAMESIGKKVLQNKVQCKAPSPISLMTMYIGNGRRVQTYFSSFGFRLCQYILLVLLVSSCSKNSFLNTRPDIALVVPENLKDYQALLDNDFTMNGLGNGPIGLTPADGEIAADDYYVTDDAFASLAVAYQNYYSFNTGFITTNVYSWNYPYASIAVANVVLDGLESVVRTIDNASAYDNIKGSALFYRSHMFYQLAQVYGAPYNESTASQEKGIPLRLHADIGEDIRLASIKETYDDITNELKEATQLLPDTALYKNRPSKVTCYALLARVFLTVGIYDSALIYADKALAIKNELLDFNTLNAAATLPFASVSYAANPEVLLACDMLYYPYPSILRGATARIDSILYNSYNANDLRKTIYFRTASPSGYRFKGSYDGKDYLFSGIAIDELYLIKAECLARKEETNASLNVLNALLEKRWKRGTFIPYQSLNADSVLQLVLSERRKELCFRGMRWTDLRRLNTEGYGINLQRVIKGQVYNLPAKDARYIYPIPNDVKGFHSDW